MKPTKRSSTRRRGRTDEQIRIELQEFLTRIIGELRTSGLSEEQIVSVFKNAAEDFAADTVERVEKREGRKLSDEEIEEISEDANAILVEALGLENLQ